MSGYNGGRKAPNVSQYLANLNTITSPETLSPQNDQGFGLDDDMNLFTNTEFFDFDLAELQNGDFNKSARNQPQALDLSASTESFASDFKFPDLELDPRFNVAQDVKPHSNTIPLAPHPPSLASSPTSVDRPSTGDTEGKRKLDAFLSTHSSEPPVEEEARVAAEEDKRRRNTAASARFRVKKKQREQALEKTSKEMTDKCNMLDAKNTRLEMENRWLKGLIMEKNDTTDLSEMWKQFSENKQGRKPEDRKDGVGTA